MDLSSFNQFLKCFYISLHTEGVRSKDDDEYERHRLKEMEEKEKRGVKHLSMLSGIRVAFGTKQLACQLSTTPR